MNLRVQYQKKTPRLIVETFRVLYGTVERNRFFLLYQLAHLHAIAHGIIMSKIPYKFFPIPPEFLTDDFIYDPEMMRLIRWMFNRISSSPTLIRLKKGGRQVHLSPFEFMYGRESCASQIGVSEKMVRGRLNQLISLGFLEKEASKTASTFTVYRLVTENLGENKGQHLGQQKGQHMGQHLGHNQDHKIVRSKKDHHPSPSSFPEVKGSDDSDDIDDDSLSRGKEEQQPAAKACDEYVESKIEMHPGVFLTQQELDECIKIRGSREAVVVVIEQYMSWKGRKSEIKNWVSAIKTWNPPRKKNDKLEENQVLGEKICKLFRKNRENGATRGWQCDSSRDSIKDQIGILLQNDHPQVQPIFIAYGDPDFKSKYSKFLIDNGLGPKETKPP